MFLSYIYLNPSQGVLIPSQDVLIPSQDVLIPGQDVLIPGQDVLIPCRGKNTSFLNPLSSVIPCLTRNPGSKNCPALRDAFAGMTLLG